MVCNEHKIGVFETEILIPGLKNNVLGLLPNIFNIISNSNDARMVKFDLLFHLLELIER